MGKSGKTDSQTSKKDNLQAKAGSGSVVKAKDKRKKSNPKKPSYWKSFNDKGPAEMPANELNFQDRITEKLAKDIRSSNEEFRKLQSKMVAEKENKKIMSCDKDEEPSTSKVPAETPISQERKVEETTQVLACL